MSYTKHNFTAGGTILAAPFNAMEDQIADNEVAIAGKVNKPSSGDGMVNYLLQSNGNGETSWASASTVVHNGIYTDGALNKQGWPADGKATGDAIALKLNKPAAGNGTSGQLLQTNGDGTTAWVNAPSGGSGGGSSVTIDATLSASGQAADAKATGDALALKQAVLTFDNAPASGSNNPVKSGGVYTALAAKADASDLTTLAGRVTANEEDISDLQDAVDELSENVIVTVTLEQGNILNAADVTVGRLGSNGAIRSDGAYADYYTTPFERIVEGQTYSAWEDYRGAYTMNLVAVYDSEYTFIQNVSTVENANNTVIIPENVNAYYARFSLGKAPIDTLATRKPRIVTGVENKAYSAYHNEEVETRVTKEYVLKSTYDAKIAELTACHAYLPSVIYCAVGRTIDLYNNQVCINASKFHFQWICTKGFAEGRRFTITADAVEDLPLTLNIYDDSNTVVYTKSATIKCVAPLTTGTLNVLPIGDSMTFGGGMWLMEVQTTLSSGAIHFVGTREMTWRENTYYHEGVNGVTASWFLSSATKGEIVNPFYNSSNNGFDYSYYLANANITTPDAVMIELGTNDMNGASASNAAEKAANIAALVQRIKTASPNTPVFVCNAIYRSNQDGIAHQMNTQGYTASSGKYKYNEDLKMFSLMVELEEALKNISGVYLVPLALCHDSENNFGKQTIKLNSRSNIDITIPADSIHPNRDGEDVNTYGYSAIGYLQFADVIFSVISGVAAASGASS